MVIPQYQHPLYLLQYAQIKGISLGACIKTGDRLRPGVAAHAHCKSSRRHYGWICVRDRQRLRNELLMLHEIAHIIAGKNAGHGEEWKRICLELGGTLNRYRITKKKWAKDRSNQIELSTS